MSRSRSLILRITAIVLTAVLSAGLSLSGLVFSNIDAEAAVGGGQTTTTTHTTSTTSGTTYQRKDLPDIFAYSTRVLGYAASSCNGGEAWLFDQTYSSDSGSAAVQSALASAASAVSGQCSNVTPASLDSSSTGSVTTYLGDEVDHTEESVTTTATFGPQTILIGDEQSQTYFVAAGTVNYNTNTHTQTFINQLYRTTVTTSETWVVKGSDGEEAPLADSAPSIPAATSGSGGTAALSGSTATPASSSLPTTGFELWLVLALGLPLVFLGSGLTVRSRRKQIAHSEVKTLSPTAKIEA